MLIGIYNVKDDSAVVLPLVDAAQWLDLSVWKVKRTLAGKRKLPDFILTKCPAGTPIREPKGVRPSWAKPDESAT